MKLTNLSWVSFLSVAGAFSVPQTTRRAFLDVTVATAVCLPPTAAVASGGATAGGAYLLSAKQRYNDRVTKGVAGFLGLETTLKAGDIDALRAYFTTEDVGGWKDLTAAGYLLANAFRRNSTAAPDSLPSVQVCLVIAHFCSL